MKMMTVTQLCCPEVVPGDLSGQCILCGLLTEEGYRTSFSSNFTLYPELFYGDCVCPYCYAFWRNPLFRRRSWLATQNGVQFGKGKEIGNYILHPPEPPFAIYITKGGQRQGWLGHLRRVNRSFDRFYIMTDFVGGVLVSLEEARRFHDIASQLRQQGVSKTELSSGEYKMRTWKRSIEKNFEMLLRDARRWVKTPLWEVIVYVVP